MVNGLMVCILKNLFILNNQKLSRMAKTLTITIEDIDEEIWIQCGTMQGKVH